MKRIAGLAFLLLLLPVLADAQIRFRQEQQHASTAYINNPLSVFAATTSAQLAGVINDETGSEALVFGTSPTITTATVSGSAPSTPTTNVLYTDSLLRAWIRFNGTGTPAIAADFNVSSITDNGAGDYTLNFATNMPSANFVVTGGANEIGVVACVVVPSTLAVGSVRISVLDLAGNPTDVSQILVMVAGG